MDTMPLEVWTAFVAIAGGVFLVLLGYIFSRWRK
jgi:LPXTG-motif cell wall-anchored protein